MTGTSIVVGKNSMLKSASENAYSKAEFAKVSELNNPYFVKEDGDLGLGANSLDLHPGIGSPIGAGRLTVTQTHSHLLPAVSLIGNGTWTSETDHANLCNGSPCLRKRINNRSLTPLSSPTERAHLPQTTKMPKLR